MKKQILFSLMFLFLIVGVQAVTIISISPPTLPNVSIGCGEIVMVDLKLSLNDENFSVGWQTKYSLTGLVASFEKTDFSVVGVGDRHLIIYYSTQSNCGMGTQTRTLNIGDKTYPITVTVKEDLYPLNDGHPFTLEEGEKFSIGNTIHFNLLEVGSNFVDYSLEGCGSSDDKLYKGDVLDKICGTERLGVEIDEILGGESVATFYISFSTESLELTKSSSDANGDTDSSECVLGIDTLGATVKRGSVFAFNTINTNGGKYEPGVIVNVLDQAGDLTPLSGTSDNTGFFSKRIHEDYEQDLLIKLFKDGCEPTNKVILFQTSYDDYKLAKGEEEGGFQLVLNMSARYELGAISGTIKNVLNEVIEGVEVKITQPDGAIITVQTGANGLFSWTPTTTGTFLLQGGKDDYESTDLVSIEVFQDKTYLIVIKVNGEQKAEYKKNDRINFELRDANNSLLPLSVVATFGTLPLNFVSGISDTVNFETTSVLTIPTVEGYLAQTITLSEKTTNFPKILVWVLGAIMVLVFLVVVVAVIRKRRGYSGGEKPPQQMEVQLGEGGS